MSANSRKGYSAEHAIEVMLADMGHQVWRPRAGATQDCGDIGGLPYVVSVKNHATLKLAEWVTRAEEMAVHAGQPSAVVWHKKRGKADPRDWYVSMSGRLFLPWHALAVKHWEG